jgi:hypothetical protein
MSSNIEHDKLLSFLDSAPVLLYNHDRIIQKTEGDKVHDSFSQAEHWNKP